MVFYLEKEDSCTYSVSIVNVDSHLTTTMLARPLLRVSSNLAQRMIQIHVRTLKPSFKRTMSSTITTDSALTPVFTSNAPGAVGPYSQAIKLKDLVFVSGNIPLDPATGEIVAGGVEEQTKQVLKNLRAVVEASGSELGKVVKTTVFLKSMGDFAVVNKIYEQAFGDHKPARSAVEVSRLPKDVLVEIECIASLG